MKNILVTGAGGFIGSHLTEFLVEKGFNVKAFVRYNSRNQWGWLEESKYKKEIQITVGDIRDFDSVLNVMHDCDTVFHLAALIGIPYSYVSPAAYIKTNIEGTYNVLESARKNNFENVIITSTSETYGTAQYVPIDEEHPMVGQSPYSASKIGADQIAISYFRSFALPVKIVRPFNTYGPRQSARAVIPTIISQLLADKPLKLGSLLPTRDLTYVKDTVKGFYEIACNDVLTGEITNIGMNQEISIGDLAHKISELMNKEIKIETEEIRIRPEKSEVERLKCNNSKLMSNTDWQPTDNLETGLMQTIEWMKNHREMYKVEMYNV
ncbi:MAG TPA: NAD-dependent 4,6-dehydratase LegB [Ignavibacteriaceae bacterium]|nr:NAD-dependent 4,6-dehydratase LegB [Ignavibacteriaceae bacterium]